MPVAISRFFEQLGYPLRNARNSWGAERDGVVVLRTWQDETTDSPATVKVLRPVATYAPGKRVGLRERQEQLSHLWSGSSAGYVVTATAKNPDEGARSIKRYDDTAVRPILSLFARDGDTWARLGDAIPVATLPAHSRRFRTARAVGTFPADEPGRPPTNSQEPSLEQRLKRFAQVEVRPQQREFREAVFRAYQGRCAVSKCAVPEALEAAHLHGRNWKEGHNRASDGVLLRRDLHALYDRRLLSFSIDKVVRLDPRVADEYAQFANVQLALVG